MKLLILTQVVDKDDLYLGFFHRWIEMLAPHHEHIHVICLKGGVYTLPENVSVHSLGKEKGYSQFRYIKNFFSLAWFEVWQYSCMNGYVLLWFCGFGRI